MAIERVSVLDLEGAARLPADPATAVLSVTDPEVVAPLAEGFAGVLRLSFHDVDDDAVAWGLPRTLPQEVVPMDAEQARRLVLWTDSLAQDDAGYRVVAHCHAGISRSSAIAWFLNQRHGAELNWGAHFQPNRRVLRLLSEVSGQRLAW
ncbi:hypothetical protein [Thiohalorhabdus sp.]|uniref:hypothetical protein n=1 Tax=Thiohalorhabdus sp. TaxID=3094134 RepID=UPI002FC35295